MVEGVVGCRGRAASRGLCQSRRLGGCLLSRQAWCAFGRGCGLAGCDASVVTCRCVLPWSHYLPSSVSWRHMCCSEPMAGGVQLHVRVVAPALCLLLLCHHYAQRVSAAHVPSRLCLPLGADVLRCVGLCVVGPCEPPEVQAPKPHFRLFHIS